jgi:hypothetical protein
MSMPVYRLGDCWLEAATVFLRLSGMTTELPQYGHLTALSPAGGSMGPPQLGHLINFTFKVFSGMAHPPN